MLLSVACAYWRVPVCWPLVKIRSGSGRLVAAKSNLDGFNCALSEQTTSWQAVLELGFAPRHGKTVLVRRRHQGPLAVQRPFYPEGGVCHVYILHPPGGIVAGDKLTIKATAEAGSSALLTTPAAGKFYRSEGRTATQRIELAVAENAVLEWLPQESIIYEGARVKSEVRLELAQSARFIGWEVLALGRPAAGEGFAGGEVDLDWQIRLAGKLLYRERLRLDAEAFNAAWGLNGHAACGTLFIFGAQPSHREQVRELIGERPGLGVTLTGELLICRGLDSQAGRLREFFQQVWQTLRPDLLQRPAAAPRIWAT